MTTTMTMKTRIPQQGDYFVSTMVSPSSNSNSTGNNSHSMIIRRIRTPHEHDVLCGRGGGINGHKGNGVFRNWVADRRLDYNLATSKADKARVAKEVMNLVTEQNPPGRFLQRDPTGGIGSWWIEIDETKTMAKTSQALREGAPTIRAQHKGELNHRRSGSSTNETHKRKREEEATSSTPSATPAMTPTFVPSPLMSNAQFEQQFIPSSPKKTRLENTMMSNAVTPTLEPVLDMSSEIPTLYLEQSSVTPSAPPTTTAAIIYNNAIPSLDPPKEDIFTQNQKAWTMDGRLSDEFVNPFENEEEKLQQFFAPSTANSCVQCGSPVQQDKDCNCMSQFDPLHQMMSTQIVSI
mmetsp:Transcript_8296/g.13734  ORF Transcript_8296/g.13734 Transcript_8296/m.13734 type:complete len:350 (+) Transcript_8296:154-1203(+)